MRRLGYLLVALVALAGCTSSGGSAKKSGLEPDAGNGKYAGVGLVPPRPRPDFTLTDTSGAKYAFGTKTAGRATLLYFGYTKCPDVCPATLADIGNAIRKQPADVQKKVTVVFVTTDVKNDTGPVIARYLRNFSPGSAATFVGLTGTQAQIDAAEAAAHILIAEDGGKTHSSQVLLYGPDDYARTSFIFNASSELEQMAHDIPLVVKNGAS